MRIVRVCGTKTIPLGRQGENQATQILFPLVQEWKRIYGPGTFQLLHQRNGDKAPYVVSISTDEQNVIWTVSSADLAVVGNGKCELTYIVNDVIAKSQIYATVAQSSMTEAGEAPEPWESWVEDVLKAGIQARESADDASESATIAADSAADASAAKDAAETAKTAAEAAAEQAVTSVEEIVGLTVTAQGLPSGSPPTVTKTGGGGTPYNFEFGIPKGDTGSPGADAKINGYSTVSIEAGENIELEQTGNVLTISGTGGGTGDHRNLTNRDSADQHPMSAITGLSSALDRKQELPFPVLFTKTGTVWSASKTFIEIAEALDGGKYVYGVDRSNGSSEDSWSPIYICVGIDIAPLGMQADVAYYFVRNPYAGVTPTMKTLAVGDNNTVAFLTVNVPKEASLGGSNALVKADIDGYLSNATPGTDYITPSGLSAYRTAAAQDVIDAGKIDTDMSVTAAGLPSGSTPTVSYDVANNRLSFGIPAGSSGTPGWYYTTENLPDYDPSFGFDLSKITPTVPVPSVGNYLFWSRTSSVYKIRSISGGVAFVEENPLSLRGAQGNKGEKGEQGAPGVPGADGADGKSIYAGSDLPSTSGYNGGDLFVRLTDGQVFRLEDEPLPHWRNTGYSIKGPQGEPGGVTEPVLDEDGVLRFM